MDLQSVPWSNIELLRSEGRYSTAHVYENALRSFTNFCNTGQVSFAQVNRESLRRYHHHLLNKGKKLNTAFPVQRYVFC